MCFVAIGQTTAFVLFWVKFFIKGCVQVLYPYTPECFPTVSRSLGNGIAGFSGRLGATVMPFVVYSLYLEHPDSPFVVFGVLSFVGLILIVLMPFDTLNRPLDDASRNPKALHDEP